MSQEDTWERKGTEAPGSLPACVLRPLAQVSQARPGGLTAALSKGTCSVSVTLHTVLCKTQQSIIGTKKFLG